MDLRLEDSITLVTAGREGDKRALVLSMAGRVRPGPRAARAQARNPMPAR